jgi:methylated-DNA-[protein]-cysteine S-methyltransferase
MDTTPLYRTTMPTPVGELTVITTDDAVVAVLWPDDDPARVRLADSVVTTDGPAVLDAAVHQLTEYFEGERTEFDLPLDPHGTPFQRAAWDVLRTIPYGTTMTYGEQATRLGDRGKARAVGAANGRNPISIVVPCHRVVGSTGSLTGFAGGFAAKAWLLDHERRVLVAAA